VNSPNFCLDFAPRSVGKSKGAESTARQTNLTTSPEPTTDALLVAVQHQDREHSQLCFADIVVWSLLSARHSAVARRSRDWFRRILYIWTEAAVRVDNRIRARLDG